jgi:hypothetical protein
MEAIPKLEQDYFLLLAGVGDFHACIDWAIERVQHDQEGDDLQIVLLAAAKKQDEVIPLVEQILRRYAGAGILDHQLAAGKYLSILHNRYLQGDETIASIDAKLTKIEYVLGYPDWLVMLSRNCEYATDVPAFEEPFKQEFAYIAELWASAQSRAEFDSRYSRSVSNQHDAKLG